ncbi:MAG: tetratricopeptide repeat protein, partial [bacterium]|nr:tetratricopeptide repeat protein [bacterium]
DPGETRNLFLQKQNQLSKQMDKKLRDYILSNSGSRLSGQRKPSASDRQKLKSLGYISSFSGQKGGVLDPKTGVTYFNQISTANGLITSGDLDRAEKILLQMTTHHPDLTMVQLFDALYSLYRKKNDPVKMEYYLKKAISDFPDLDDYPLQLARFYFDNGNPHAAEKLCRDVLKRDSLSSHANIILGKIYYQKKDAARSLSYFERALELEPRNQRVRLEYASTLLAVGKTGEVRKIVAQLMNDAPFMQDPETIDMKIGIGAILMQLNQPDQVISLN